MNKLLKKSKKWIPIAAIVGATLVFMLTFVYLAFLRPAVSDGADGEIRSISYVLVNEDRGAIFNNIEYNLGTEFVFLVNQDPVHLWHTASRSIATAGLASGAYDVKIILPQNFSENLLSLQSFTPEQAQIFYEVRPGLTDVTRAMILENVGLILRDFNERIIQMYFSSILGNLFDAQHNVRIITQDKYAVQNTMLNNIHNPFEALPYSFSTVITDAQLLSEQKMSWQERQELFTEQVQEFLLSTAEEFSISLGEMEEYHQLQALIAQINLINAQNAVVLQAGTDEAFYRDIFSNFNEAATTGLNEFLFTDDTDNQVGTMQELILERQRISEIQDGRLGALIEMIDELNRQAEDLAELRGDIAEKFFYDREATPDTADDDDIRSAIISHITLPDVTTSNLPQIYLNRLHTDISGLDIEALEEVIDILHNDHNLLNTNRYNEYNLAFDIIRRYVAETTSVNFVNTSVPFTLTGTVDPIFPSDESFRRRITVSLATGSMNTLTLSVPNNDATLGFEEEYNNDYLEDIIEGMLLNQLINLGIDNYYTVNVNKQNSTTIQIWFELDPPSGAVPPFPTMPENFIISFYFNIIWDQFTAAQENSVFNSAEFIINLNGAPIFRGEVAFDFELHYAKLIFIDDDFNRFIEQSNRLNQIARQIVSIHGPATASGQTLQGYSQFLNIASVGNTYTMRELGKPSSVYWSYGQLTEVALKQLVSDVLLVEFRASGEELWNRVNTQYNDLRTAISGEYDEQAADPFESLEVILSRLPTPDLLEGEVFALLEWHYNIRNALVLAYEEWIESPVMQLEVVPFTGETAENDTRLFIDTTTGEMLFTRMQFLVDSTSSHAQTTGYAAADIQSLEERFIELTTRTEEVRTDAQNVLDGMGDLLDGFIPLVADNLAYAENFGEVLRNARIGGADNPDVMGFLANPLSPVRTIEPSARDFIVPYYMTVIGALLMFVVGLNARHVDVKRRMRETQKHLVMTRTWHNMPTAIKTIIISTCFGLIFGVSSYYNVPYSTIFLWVPYVTLVTMAGILLVSYFARQAPKVAPYLCLGLFGVYLLFTPILGIHVPQGSLIANVLNISPLQNIENGYSLLVQGASAGLLYYITLAALVGFGFWLNTLVKYGKHEVVA